MALLGTTAWIRGSRGELFGIERSCWRVISEQRDGGRYCMERYGIYCQRAGDMIGGADAATCDRNEVVFQRWQQREPVQHASHYEDTGSGKQSHVYGLENA